jgi:hypothetical protein
MHLPDVIVPQNISDHISLRYHLLVSPERIGATGSSSTHAVGSSYCACLLHVLYPQIKAWQS